ncbi:MAG TPA: universal stress protein [Steroidobacteraceae bacterium]|nr:universal stress protein [Steroidobacteraceae bacterium]
MKATRRILFAIRNPVARRQPGLAKAIQVARALDATLELFHAITDPVFIEFARLEENTVDALRERIEGEVRIPLARLCATARKHGVAAESSVSWDYPAHEAIVRRATAIDAHMIIAECHKGVRTRPWLLHLTDWELLRASPVPVLLLKGGKPYHRPLTLAAVDPAHVHAKPANLDGRIVAAAKELCAGLCGKLHVMHASHPSIIGLDAGAAARRAARTWSTLSYEELQIQERRAFEEFRVAHGIPRTRAHLVEGNPAAQIPRMATECRAAIVVMGALSRSGLERIFIGNTAERILGKLECDVLVIRPEHFRTRVAREPRGLRVMAPTTAVA